MDKTELTKAVIRAQEGDVDAITELYNSFYNSVYYFAKKTVKDDDLALDITQETFMEVIRTIGSLKAPEAFSTWLRQITYHQCTRYFRKNKEVLLDEDEEGNTILDNMADENEESIPEEVYEKAEFREIILSMIDELPEEQRAVVILYYYDELPVKKIAEIQEVSEGTIKSRLNYARKALLKGVETYEEKTGIKLHCIPFLPLFKLFINEPAAMSAADAALIGETVSSAAAEIALSSATGATAASTATASATTATSTATAAAATASTTAATAGATAAVSIPLAVKITAAVLAVSVTLGGGAMVIKKANDAAADSKGTTAIETTEGSNDSIDADLAVTDTTDIETSETTEPLTEEPTTDTPETDLPETDAPETDTPVTDVPETDEPVTATPETDAPVTNVPETDAPVTSSPETEASTEAVTDLPMGFACLATHLKPSVTIQTVQHEPIDGITVLPDVSMTIKSNSYEFEPENAVGHGFSIYVDGKKISLPVTMPNGQTYAMTEFTARPEFTFTLSSWVWKPGTHEIKIVPTCMFIGKGMNNHDATAEELTVTVIYDLSSTTCPGCGGNAKFTYNETGHFYICEECNFYYGEEEHTFVDGVCKCGTLECETCGKGINYFRSSDDHQKYCSYCEIQSEPEPHTWSEWVLVDEAANKYERTCFCGASETTTTP